MWQHEPKFLIMLYFRIILNLKILLIKLKVIGVKDNFARIS